MINLENLGKTDQENQTFTLADGRILGFAEYGDLKGTPLMYFHGTGSCRYEAVEYHEVGLKLKVRIISLDRPSVGLSTEHKNRTLLDWPKDVCALADRLDIARFSVVGISGGAPHALVCAHVNPDRVTGCAMVVPVAPRTPESKGWTKTKKMGRTYEIYTRLPWLYGMLTKVAEKKMYGDSINEKELNRMPICEADKQVCRETFKALHLISKEVSRQGYGGVLQDLTLFKIKGNHPWGFDLRALSPAIKYSIWVGGYDDLYLHGKEMAEQIPNCELFEFPELGHLSTPVNNVEAIVKYLA